jgi:adenylate cyclase
MRSMQPSDVAAVEAWLRTAPHVADAGASLMLGLVERLRTAGLPLWRCSFNLMTKHPELVWQTVQWSEEAGVRVVDRPRAALATAYFTASPVARLRQGAPPIRVRLDGDAPEPEYAICRDLQAQGATDYMAQGLPGVAGEISYVSWATRRPGGFGDAEIAGLTSLAPALAQRIELESAYRATRALLEVYLGRNAGRRVMEGEFRRGGGELIDAAIWFCDLRGFTSMSDGSAPREVVETLDAYFERVAGAVMERGGEVLKFVGDAVLAIFPTAGDAARACGAALVAAEDALAALAALNEERAARGRPPLAIGVALHVGPVMYGNIGARDRLDFTVISAAVNEACRLEGLCKVLGTPLAMSEAFVAAAAPVDAVDLGRHALKGVDAPVRVLTLARLASGA